MKLNIKLKNCYGISLLENEIDFSEKNICSIYASNGTMKTSFAKTFVDLSRGEKPKDEIYPDRETICEIKTDGSDLKKENIFVINPYDQEYKSDNISTLLVNQELKKKFDTEYQEIQKQKEGFLKSIQKLSGLKPQEIELEICNIFFQDERNKFFEALEGTEKEILNNEEAVYQDIKYNELFNDKTKQAIESSDFLSNIDNYVKKYNELLEKSNFFKKGVFNHTQASDIATQLDKNGFFKAEHTVMLNGRKEPVKTKNDLEKVITEEKNSILQDKKLQDEFEKLDKILKKNANIKNFRECLSNNPQIVSELSNPASFKAKLWKSYFKQDKNVFKDLLSKYAKSKETIKAIREQAQKEKGDWHKVISDFNNKFFVPFSLHVSNQVNVMLNNELPQIKFKFEDTDVEENKLLKVLSQGEKRALYILNILFEVKVRKNNSRDCLFVIDDIADSFDYKNKYAIIEYLKEIAEVDGFYLIILTHNFDFHRSVCGRLDMKGKETRKNVLNVVKTNAEIKLVEEIYQNNPLKYWRNNLDKPNMLLASIPMVRNLFEYSGKDTEFQRMTSFLHIQNDTNSLTLKNLKELYVLIFESQVVKKINNLDTFFYDLLIQECDQIYNDEKLESKIILSIAIRLKAEEFMILKIDNEEFINNISKNQTVELFNEYKTLPNIKIKDIKVLEQVNLMTPENIHLNSFMYEPILDMNSDELIKLYKIIKRMLEGSE
jgi:energy-coupling factor transporter ATP-binding protein EcfA2